MDRLKGKVCIVTGAALGIGRACVLRLAAEGASIAAFDVLDDAGASLIEELRALPGNSKPARYWHVDVASEASVQAAINEVSDYFGAVDVLVNNAGIAGVNKPTHEITEAEWDRVQSVNVKGVSVHPGFIWTPMVEHHLRDSGATDIDAARHDVDKLHPLGHMGEPDDIAWGVVYLASDESKFITGAQLVIDGGYTGH